MWVQFLEKVVVDVKVVNKVVAVWWCGVMIYN